MDASNNTEEIGDETTERVGRLQIERLIDEIIEDLKPDTQLTRTAVEALREASELFLVQLFEDALLSANRAGRVAIMPEDMQSALRSRAQLNSLPEKK